MTEDKFKVGDVVEILRSTYSSLKVGNLGEVTEVASHGVCITGERGTSLFFEVNNIKLHSEKTTGSRYNSGKLRWRNVPMFILRPVVEVGAAAEKLEGNPTGKYPTYNYLQGLSVADCMDCLKRHLDAVDDPTQPDIDPEDGQHHLAKIAWNALVALHHIENNPELDDRYKGPLK